MKHEKEKKKKPSGHEPNFICCLDFGQENCKFKDEIIKLIIVETSALARQTKEFK